MLYTFILYYRGGTYIDRVDAPDVMTATRIWAEKTANDPGIQYLDGPYFRKVFEEEIEEFPPVEIESCPNIWHLFFFSGRNRMDIHVVKTSDSPEPVHQNVSADLQVRQGVSAR